MAEPTHRRGPAVLEQVLDATLALLAEHGYGFSVDDVAREANVHKTTIYRRWPTKAALVGAAVARLAALAVPADRSADPIADLTHLALGVARALRTGAGTGALRAVLAAAGDDPEIVPTARQFLTGRYQLAVDIINDGVAAGTFRDDNDPTVIWEAIVNPLHIRAILGTPASDHTTRQLVTLAVAGAAPHPIPSTAGTVEGWPSR
jgi:AcrR family transcriptional regulator